MAADPDRGRHREPALARRRLLQGAGALAGALAGVAGWPAHAAALPDEARAFAASSFPEALSALGGVPVASTQITLELADIVDDGAVVPITVTSRLPGTREILIVVDVNPQPLAVRFSIPEGTEPYVAARIRMAQSGTVYAAVRTDDGLFATSRSAQVTVGGCG
jgi:sulfur-oxidizing protein SoxY